YQARVRGALLPSATRPLSQPKNSSTTAATAGGASGGGAASACSWSWVMRRWYASRISRGASQRPPRFFGGGKPSGCLPSTCWTRLTSAYQVLRRGLKNGFGEWGAGKTPRGQGCPRGRPAPGDAWRRTGGQTFRTSESPLVAIRHRQGAVNSPGFSAADSVNEGSTG